MTNEQREWRLDYLNHRAIQLGADGRVVRAIGLKNTVAALNALEQELRDAKAKHDDATAAADSNFENWQKAETRLQTMEQALRQSIIGSASRVYVEPMMDEDLGEKVYEVLIDIPNIGRGHPVFESMYRSLADAACGWIKACIPALAANHEGKCLVCQSKLVDGPEGWGKVCPNLECSNAL
jgi:hypothetical protein